MTDNIQKLYEIAGVERIYSEFNNDKETIVERVFSPYRQLELIKWLAVHFEECKLCYDEDYKWYCQTYANSSYCCEKSEDALANLIFSLWEELTEEQKKEIKRILE